MIITCYYDIYNDTSRFNTYLSLFLPLTQSSVHIVIFTEPRLVSILKKYLISSNVTIVGISLKDFELYNLAMNYNGPLPSVRNVKKDTKEYLALINTKVEFVKKASEIFQTVDTFIWIDFGLLKVITDKSSFINRLNKLDKLTFSKIYIAGIWPFNPSSFSVDSINWRFCGGVFILPRSLILPFFNRSEKVLQLFCNSRDLKLTWEVNVWTFIEMYYNNSDSIIQWYKSDHNDSILFDIE